MAISIEMIDLMFGIGIPIGLTLLFSALSDFDETSLVVYFCLFMGISLYGDLIELWMFVASFILMVMVIGYKLLSKGKGNGGGGI